MENKMTVAEAASIVESEHSTIDIARAVLTEIAWHFEGKLTDMRCINPAHILHLTYAVNRLLIDAQAGLQKASDGLHELSKAEKGA